MFVLFVRRIIGLSIADSGGVTYGEVVDSSHWDQICKIMDICHSIINYYLRRMFAGIIYEILHHTNLLKNINTCIFYGKNGLGENCYSI